MSPDDLHGKTTHKIQADYQEICKNMSMEGLIKLRKRIEHSIRNKKTKHGCVKEEIKKRRKQ